MTENNREAQDTPPDVYTSVPVTTMTLSVSIDPTALPLTDTQLSSFSETFTKLYAFSTGNFLMRVNSYTTTYYNQLVNPPSPPAPPPSPPSPSLPSAVRRALLQAPGDPSAPAFTADLAAYLLQTPGSDTLNQLAQQLFTPTSPPTQTPDLEASTSPGLLRQTLRTHSLGSGVQVFALDPRDLARADGSGELYAGHPAANCPDHEARRDEALVRLQALLGGHGRNLSQAEVLRQLALGHPWAAADAADERRGAAPAAPPPGGTPGDLLLDYVWPNAELVQRDDAHSTYRLYHGGTAASSSRGLRQDDYAALLKLSNTVVMGNGTLRVPRATLTLSLYFENADQAVLNQNLASVNYAKAMIRQSIPVARLAVVGGPATDSYYIVTGRLGMIDLVVPELMVVGSTRITVEQFASYFDSGATAVDDVDGDIPRFKVYAVGLPVDTTKVGSTTVSYYAYDYAGNRGGPVTRTVVVYDPCVASGETMCTETRTCSVLGSCKRDSVLLLSGLSQSSSADVNTGPVYGSAKSAVFDKTAPVITMLPLTATRFITADGKMSGVVLSLTVNDVFDDPGATVADDLDGDVQSSLVRRGQEVVDMTRPTTATAPYIISYNARDSSGNAAVSKFRLLYVRCPSGQKTCKNEDTNSLYCGAECGVPLVPGAASESRRRRRLAASTTMPLPSAQAVPTNLANTAPTIQLKGSSRVTIAQGTAYQACPLQGDTANACDLGATAADAQDGDLTYRIKVCPYGAKGGQSLFGLVGISNCGLTKNTPPGKYRLDFRVDDPFGASAVAYRTVIIQQQCLAGEALCPNYYCSVQGRCAGGSIPGLSAGADDALTASPPAVQLINNNTLNDTISVVQGYSYQKCAAGVIPSATAPCELGVFAWDTATGSNLTSRVFACPPLECQTACVSCRGHEFGVKGINGCVNTAAAVNTPIRLVFVVCDLNQPTGMSTIERLINIISPCSGATPYLCAGSCYAVPCSAAALVNTTDAPEPGPTLTLTLNTAALSWSASASPSPPSPPSPTSSTSSSVISTSTSNLTVYLQYGVASAFSFLPCPSAAAAANCVAAAVDAGGNDVTASIRVEDVTPCAAAACTRCSPGRMTLGLCVYGNYTFRYTATSSSGTATTSLYISFLVEAYYSVDATYQPAANVNASMAAGTLTALQANASAVQALLLPVIGQVANIWSVRGLRVLSIVKTQISGTTYNVEVAFRLTVGYVSKALDASGDAAAARRRSSRSLLEASADVGSAAAPAAAPMAAPPTWQLGAAASGAGGLGMPLLAAALVRDPTTLAQRAVSQWVHRWALPALQRIHDDTLQELDSLGALEVAGGGGSGRQLLDSSSPSYNTTCPTLNASATSFSATLQLSSSTCSSAVPDASAVALAKVFSVLSDIQRLEADIGSSIQAINTSLTSADNLFDSKDLKYDDSLAAYNKALRQSYSVLSGIITKLPVNLLDKQMRSSTAITVDAANALLSASQDLVSQLASNVAVSTLDVLTGLSSASARASGNSSGTNYTADPRYASYLSCLLIRANGARWALNVHRYTPPSRDYVAAVLAGSGAGAAGSLAQASSGRRRLADAGTAPGLLSGYPVQAVVEGSLVYSLPAKATQRRRVVGAKGNLLMGGAFLHQVRNPISSVVVEAEDVGTACASRYSDLRTGCIPNSTSAVYNFQDNGWYGLDPVFYNRSTLFDNNVATSANQYYNTSSCLNGRGQSCGETNQYGSPFGFQPREVPHYSYGFPLALTTHLPRARLQQLLQYIRDGQYVDAELTKEMTLELVTFNADTRTFGYSKLSFLWGGDGFISLTMLIQGLPAVDYSNYISAKQYGYFVPDWFVVVLAVVYIIITTIDVAKSLRSQSKIVDDNQATGAIKLSPEEVYQRKLKLKSEYRPRMDWYWIIFEYSLCVLMAIAIGLQFFYIFNLSPNAPLDTQYPVYDADITAPAHFFMIKKDESAFKASTYNSLLGMGVDQSLGSRVAATQPNGMPAPGQPYRWALPDNPRGLYDMANMYRSMSAMVAVYTGYSMLQGIILMLLIVRLIHYLSFQPRLSVVSGTLARMIPDLFHFMIILTAVACMFAMMALVVYGYRVKEVSTYSLALAALFKLFVVKSPKNAADGFGLHALVPHGVELSVGEEMLAYVVFVLAPMFFIYLFLNFFVAQILYPYIWMKTHNRDKPHVWDDMSFFLRCSWQKAWCKAPSNKDADRMVDWLLMPKIGNNWWYNTIYRAIMHNTARKSAGLSGSRLGRGQEKVIEVEQKGHAHRFNYKRLAGEMDLYFSETPHAEAQATQLLKASPGLRFAKMRRLKHVLGMGSQSRVASELGKLQAKAKGEKPMSPLTKLRTGSSKGGKGDGRVDDGDVAGRLSKLMLERFGQAMTKRQAKNLDEVMDTICRRLNSRGRPSSGSTSTSYAFPPMMYGAPYPYSYYPFATPPGSAGALGAGGIPAEGPRQPPEDLLLQHNMRRAMAHIGGEIAQLADEAPGENDVEYLSRAFAGMLAAAAGTPTTTNASTYAENPDLALAHALFKAVNGGRTPPGPPAAGVEGFFPGAEPPMLSGASIRSKRPNPIEYDVEGREVSFVRPFSDPDNEEDPAAAGHAAAWAKRASQELSTMGMQLMAAATGRTVEEVGREYAGYQGRAEEEEEGTAANPAGAEASYPGTPQAGAIRQQLRRDESRKPWHKGPSEEQMREAAHTVVHTLISHALHLSRELKVVQDDVNHQLMSTQSIINAILARRFVPHSLHLSLLPGTPTGSRKDLEKVDAMLASPSKARSNSALMVEGSSPSRGRMGALMVEPTSRAGSFSASAWPAIKGGDPGTGSDTPASPRAASRLPMDQLDQQAPPAAVPAVSLSTDLQMEDLEDEAAEEVTPRAARPMSSSSSASSATRLAGPRQQLSSRARTPEDEVLVLAGSAEPAPGGKAPRSRDEVAVTAAEARGVAEFVGRPLRGPAAAAAGSGDEVLVLSSPKSPATLDSAAAAAAASPTPVLKKKKKKVVVEDGQGGAEGLEAAADGAPVKKVKKVKKAVEAGGPEDGAVTDGAVTDDGGLKKVKSLKKKKKKAADEAGTDAEVAGAVTEGDAATDGESVKKVKKKKKKAAEELQAGDAAVAAAVDVEGGVAAEQLAGEEVKTVKKKKKKVVAEPQPEDAAAAAVIDVEGEGAAEAEPVKKVKTLKKKKKVAAEEPQPEDAAAAAAIDVEEGAAAEQEPVKKTLKKKKKKAFEELQPEDAASAAVIEDGQTSSRAGDAHLGPEEGADPAAAAEEVQKVKTKKVKKVKKKTEEEEGTGEELRPVTAGPSTAAPAADSMKDALSALRASTSMTAARPKVMPAQHARAAFAAEGGGEAGAPEAARQ